MNLFRSGEYSVTAVLKLEKTYGAERLEAACTFALTRFHSPRYRQPRTIHAEKLDKAVAKPDETTTESGYIRGAVYYSNLAVTEEGGEADDAGRYKAEAL